MDFDDDGDRIYRDDELGFDESGLPTTWSLAQAVQTWSILQTREDAPNRAEAASVAAAALAFCVTPERVAEAVEMHPFMYLSGDAPLHEQTIEHDGA